MTSAYETLFLHPSVAVLGVSARTCGSILSLRAGHSHLKVQVYFIFHLCLAYCWVHKPFLVFLIGWAGEWMDALYLSFHVLKSHAMSVGHQRTMVVMMKRHADGPWAGVKCGQGKYTFGFPVFTSLRPICYFKLWKVPIPKTTSKTQKPPECNKWPLKHLIRLVSFECVSSEKWQICRYSCADTHVLLCGSLLCLLGWQDSWRRRQSLSFAWLANLDILNHSCAIRSTWKTKKQIKFDVYIS